MTTFRFTIQAHVDIAAEHLFAEEPRPETLEGLRDMINAAGFGSPLELLIEWALYEHLDVTSLEIEKLETDKLVVNFD